MSGALVAQRFSWRKLSAAKWSDSWLERLAFLGPTRAMVIEFPGARTVRVEAHGLTRREADGFVKMFGGQVREAKWLPAVDPAPRPPMMIRGRLAVVSTERARDELLAQPGGPHPLLVPAGMAFGTGDHATTATCLRLLADLAHEREPGAWDALDLGTGSGILALGARLLGAHAVLAGDFDPHAVRTAKQNVRANQLRGVKVVRLDVRTWQPERRWPVITANLFSGLLLEVAPKIVRALEPGGDLVFSGILRAQEEEVLNAFTVAGLVIGRVLRKGKWVAGRARRASGKIR